MAYIPQGFTDQQETYILDSVGELVKRQKAEESRRKWTLLIGGVSAFFAAVRLGIIAIPKIKSARQRRIGSL